MAEIFNKRYNNVKTHYFCSKIYIYNFHIVLAVFVRLQGCLFLFENLKGEKKIVQQAEKYIEN